MRLFLGSFAQIPRYDEIRDSFKNRMDANWVAPRNLHLTWYFLGKHPSPVPFIEKLRGLAMIPRLPMGLHDIGYFNPNDPRILYLAPSPTVPKILHEKIAEMLGMDPHPNFRPHVTLARIHKILDPAWQEALPTWQNGEFGRIDPTIYLIESRLTPHGPIYLPIEEFAC